jgi:hypothetical protein
VSIRSFAAEEVVKNFDGYRVLCQTSEQVQELSQEKLIRVTGQAEGVLDIDVVKCTKSGWVLDAHPNVERVDQPEIVSYPIYQYFHQYNLYAVHNGNVIFSMTLDGLLKTAHQTITISNWEPQSEIDLSVIVETKNDKGEVIDQQHEESYGSYNLFQK